MTADVIEFRPKRIRVVAWVSAVFLVAVFTVVGLLLGDTPTGVIFRTSDQVAMVFLGVLLACGMLLLARPRVRADAEGVEVRNVVTVHRFAWPEVLHVSFPDGASWARLELPDDEYVSIMAVQAVDRDHAVAAVRALRDLHKAATT
ncbi:PH domain-containing protein [Saccharothrix sp. 6-C]|uniref:PH (Pleckstrin Homology) domain-containing protein n=1 Tax=Saccharothrix texasensis TaxID=103734 RepID=A0A3N1HG34_9PSEU|nr:MULTISPECIES: PH domain-containing protein [Saccharothrix]QQQ74467.1 PH domain-containing protein [Saccharothrix sp. 6-C]ROP41479.1 PH (Pleckstrin Homology) domain-containing protein [Saccharothrix texasensis]